MIGTLSRPASGGQIQTETADDFILSRATMLNQATLTGLLPLGASLASISDVEIEIYNVFPTGSANPPSGNVPSRVNSPSDNEIGSATRDGIAGSLSYTSTLLNPKFTVANTVVNGINKKPHQFTGGEGPATGEEVQISVIFNQPIVLGADHYFFRPEVQLTNGDFLWLSAPKPIVPPGTPFSPDLQTWIRNDNLAPDWLRIGTDITHESPFNASFSLTGTTVPEPSTQLLLHWTSGVGGFHAEEGHCVSRNRSEYVARNEDLSGLPASTSAERTRLSVLWAQIYLCDRVDPPHGDRVCRDRGCLAVPD